MNMHCVMSRWVWQVFLAILTRSGRPIVPGDTEKLVQTFCGFTSKKQHIIQLRSGPASVRFSCVLSERHTEKPQSYHPASKYLSGSPAKTTLPQTALQTIPQCRAERCVTVGAEDTMAYHVTWCNHHYKTKHLLDEMTSSTLMITACLKAQITEWVHRFTRLRRHNLHLT